jgi:hypothetical protein
VFTVRVGDQILRLQACEYRDSVSELAAAANTLAERSTAQDVWMCDEPTYYRWQFKPAGERLRVVVECHCEGEVRVALEVEIETEEFVREVQRILWELSYYHDLDCYRDFWNHDFPVELFRSLTRNCI